MTSAAPPSQVPPAGSRSRVSDPVLIAVAVAGVVLAVASAVAGSLGLLPDGVSIVLVLAPVTVALRVALLLRARSSSSLSNPLVMRVVSYCGLGLSAVAAITTLGITFTNGESPWLFLGDLGVQAWSLLILMAAASPVRSMNWIAFAGVALGGFLAASALARFVGSPVVTALGADNFAAESVWVPVTEELLKALPVAIIALIAMRNQIRRPSVIDITLLGAFSGGAYTLIEDAEFHRIFGDWNAAPPLSFIFPSMARGFQLQPIDAVAGHLVWTALFCMGIGFGLLYFRRFRFAWIAIPATFVVVVFEHAMSNAGATVFFGGVFSPVVLILGFAFFVWFERRPLRGFSTIRDGLLLKPAVIDGRRLRFAQMQRPTPATNGAGQ